jgi:hypothetical protein
LSSPFTRRRCFLKTSKRAWLWLPRGERRSAAAASFADTFMPSCCSCIVGTHVDVVLMGHRSACSSRLLSLRYQRQAGLLMSDCMVALHVPVCSLQL